MLSGCMHAPWLTIAFWRGLAEEGCVDLAWVQASRAAGSDADMYAHDYIYSYSLRGFI